MKNNETPMFMAISLACLLLAIWVPSLWVKVPVTVIITFTLFGIIREGMKHNVGK